MTGVGVASAGAVGAVAIKKKKKKTLLALLPLLAPLLKSGVKGKKGGSPKILALAGGKAKVKIVVFPKVTKVNNEKTEIEEADDKVRGGIFLQLDYSADELHKISHQSLKSN